MADFKINSALCFSPEDLTRFMKYNAALNLPIDNTITNEIAAALIYRIAIEKELKWSGYYIYFEPRNDKQKELLSTIDIPIRASNFVDFLSDNVEQSSLYDVYYVMKNGHSAAVRPVQIKRFGKGCPRENLAEQLIKYLETKIICKYPNNRGTLLIYMENAGELEPQKIVNWLNKDGFNFEELCVCGLREDKTGWIIQLLPNRGEAGVVFATKEEIFLV